MQRIGEPWLPGRPYRDRMGAYAIIVGMDGTLLLVDERGELQLPGGGIDPGESPVRALHREVMEETGWRIGHPRRIGAFQRFAWLPDYGFWARKVQFVFAARAVRRIGPPTEGWHRPLWVAPVDAVRNLDIAGDRAMVHRAIRSGLI